LDLARRKTDPADRRSVLVQRTVTGAAFLREIRTVMTESEAGLRQAATAEPANGDAEHRVAS
ncbi:MAG: MarR family transcriptional regulator, partial [Acetobacteraceae bacterium]